MSNSSLSTGSVLLLLDGYRDMGRPGLLIMVGKSELRTSSARRRSSASLWAWVASRARPKKRMRFVTLYRARKRPWNGSKDVGGDATQYVAVASAA
jgi:hypothetical protein